MTTTPALYACALQDEIARFLPARVEDAYWIHGADEGANWCYDCARAKARHLRRHSKVDATVDGGWRTEHDGMPHCEGCAAPLDGALTEYGASEEIDALLCYGVRPANPYDALFIDEILNAACWSDQPDIVRDAIDLAEAFLWSAT